MLGSTLRGGLRLEKVLGRGGFGTVYLASGEGSQKVAVKTLELGQVDPLERRAAVEQFHAEAELLSQLEHPGLVKVHGAFEEDGRHFLVMDFVDGITLAQGIKRKKGFFPLSQFQHLANQLCDVLQYLHNRIPAVIFRDLKPSNIMVTRLHEVRLIDFGIARLFTDDTRTQTFIKGFGSAGYAPLEQYGAGTTDPRSDIYSLGATFYAFLTKRVPPPVVSIVAEVETLEPMSAINPEVPEYLDAVVARMMSIRKEQRFDSIEALRPLLFHPPEDDEDPTGTLRLAEKRQKAAELGPCLVVRRVGPEVGPFTPAHCPLAQTRLEPAQPYTLILGLKSEVDPQSGLHFQKGEKKKHASGNIDLGFKGAAALVVCDDPKAPIKGERLLEQIKAELSDMACRLLEEAEDLETDYQLAAVPVLEKLAQTIPDRALNAHRFIYRTYLKAVPGDSSLLQKKTEQLARLLTARGLEEEARPLYERALAWLEKECLKEVESRGFGEAAELQARWQALAFDLADVHTLGHHFLAKLADSYQRRGRSTEDAYRVAELAAQPRGDVQRAQATLWKAQHLLLVHRWEEAERAAQQALEIAEQLWDHDSPKLYLYVDTLAQAGEHLMRPERLELKSRALILKYKAKL